MNLNKAIEFAQLVNAAYAILPDNLANSAGKALIAGGTAYTVVTTIYANDLATDINPGRGNKEVSIGFVCQADGTGDVAIAIRGTEGIQEWINDAHFLLVPCPFSREPASRKMASPPCTIPFERVMPLVRQRSSTRWQRFPSRSRSAR